VNWITVTFATGSGIGQVNYTVAANTTGVARTGTLLVAGQTVTFSQAAPSCTYTVTPTAVTAPAGGSASSVSVSSGTGCSWTAVSSASWIAITAGASGSSNGAVNFTVAANSTSTPRTGTLTVAGQTVTVTQPALTPPTAPSNLRIIR
jgi:hypothetical protein